MQNINPKGSYQILKHNRKFFVPPCILSLKIFNYNLFDLKVLRLVIVYSYIVVIVYFLSLISVLRKDRLRVATYGGYSP